MGNPAANQRAILHGVSHRYVMVQKLGAGGMGATWVVFDHKMGELKQFAIKVLASELARSARAKEHFVHEARATAALEHPNIVTVLWLDELTDGTPLYAMELLNGASVSAALKHERSFPLPIALNVAVDALNGLHFAHKHGLVHQDVKPSNLMLHVNGANESIAKIIDFGVVRTLDDRGRGFSGTLSYAAPEQFTGGEVKPTTDVFGLGALLFEMITGRGPFADYPNTFEGAIARSDKRPPSLRDFLVPGGCPAALVELVDASLSPRAGDRPQSAKELAQALRVLARELAPREKLAHISHVGAPILRSKLADTTEPGGVDLADLMARMQVGTPEPESVGVSETFESPPPFFDAVSPAPVLNEPAPARVDLRGVPLGPDTAPTRPEGGNGARGLAALSERATAPPSQIVAAPNVEPVYVDSLPHTPRMAHDRGEPAPAPRQVSLPPLEPAEAAALASAPVATASAPVATASAAVATASAPKKGFVTVPMAGRPVTLRRYSPWVIRLRRLYQSRRVRDGLTILFALGIGVTCAVAGLRWVRSPVRPAPGVAR